MAIIAAHKNLYALFYMKSTQINIMPIAEKVNLNPTVTYNSDDNVIHLEFSDTVWGGISILPF